MARITLPTAEIRDFESFHAVFARTLGFHGHYQRNMDAWTDCMACVDEPGTRMTSVTVARGEQLTLEIPESMALKNRAPDVFAALVEGTAAVNERFVKLGELPIIALILT